jgi:hypothetical protein
VPAGSVPKAVIGTLPVTVTFNLVVVARSVVAADAMVSKSASPWEAMFPDDVPEVSPAPV